MSIAVEKVLSGTTLRAGDRGGRRSGLPLAVSDLLAVSAAFIATWIVVGLVSEAPIVPGWLVVPVVVLAGLLCVAMFAAYRLYDNDRTRIAVATFDEVKDVFHALVVSCLAIALANEAIERLSAWRIFGLGTAVLFVATSLLLVPLARSAMRAWVMPRLSRPERTLIVGSGLVALLLYRKLESHPEYGLSVVGFLDGDPMDEDLPKPLLGSPEHIAEVVEGLEIDRVIIAFSTSGHEEMLQLVRTIRRPDVQVSIVPRYFEIFTSHAVLDDLHGVPVVTLPSMRLGTSSRVLKRAFDVVVSAALLAILAPAMLAITIAIRLDSPGPGIYRQPRRGRNGTIFTIHKFRTMRMRAEEQRNDLLHLNEADGPLFKIKVRDPRVTRVGDWLRRTSLDELPQLWDVLMGDMSLVGPRPFVLHEADQITGWRSRRLDARPGITGLWQTMGRNDLSFAEMVKLDYLYVTNWSLWWDLKILWQTLPGVLRRRGAY